MKPMLPSPIIPREWPRGLWDTAAAWVWQSEKAAGEPRAAVVHLFLVRSGRFKHGGITNIPVEIPECGEDMENSEIGYGF